MTSPIALMRNALRPKWRGGLSKIVRDERPGLWEGVGDGHLLSEIATGDVEALGELYDRHGLHCWAVARQSSADVEAAAEAVLVAFIEIWKQAPTLPDELVREWLSAETRRP